jgi:hypothetical protein
LKKIAHKKGANVYVCVLNVSEDGHIVQAESRMRAICSASDGTLSVSPEMRSAVRQCRRNHAPRELSSGQLSALRLGPCDRMFWGIGVFVLADPRTLSALTGHTELSGSACVCVCKGKESWLDETQKARRLTQGDSFWRKATIFKSARAFTSAPASLLVASSSLSRDICPKAHRTIFLFRWRSARTSRESFSGLDGF